MDTQHTRCNRVNPLLHEGCSRPVQPLEKTALQRGTGFLIIPWSLVRIQAGPGFHRRQIRSVSGPERSRGAAPIGGDTDGWTEEGGRYSCCMEFRRRHKVGALRHSHLQCR